MYGKWVYKRKFHSDGSLALHKARWTKPSAQLSNRQRYMLSSAPPPLAPGRFTNMTSRIQFFTCTWRTSTANSPSGFVNPAHPNYVCLLQHSLYGLKHAPRVLYQRFAMFIKHLGFTASTSDTSTALHTCSSTSTISSSLPPGRTSSSASVDTKFWHVTRKAADGAGRC